MLRTRLLCRRSVQRSGTAVLGLGGIWWLSKGVVELEEKKEAPKKPGIYQSAGFDPSAVEDVARILKNARTLNDLNELRSEDAQEQKKHRDKAAEYKKAAQELAREARDAKRQEDAKTRDARRQHEEARSQYRAALAKERSVAAQRLDQALKDGEEGLVSEHEKKLDAIRRESAEYEATLRREVDAAYLKAKATWTARTERASQDLRLAELRERGKAGRDATIEAVKASLTTLGTGLNTLLSDEKRCLALCAVSAAGALGIFAARHATRIAANYVRARLAKPALVRETSRGYGIATSGLLPNAFANLVSRLESYTTPTMPRADVAVLSPHTRGGEANTRDSFATALLQGAAFEPGLEAQLLRVAASAANTRHHRAPFRHALLHGPPGTGKTMYAKRLAASAGMDFAIASGGDVAPLGRDAVTEIHKLFDWASTSPRGLLLLIDEAEAFARSRSLKPRLSEDARNALNAFLYRTGTPNSHVLVLFATNAPELFDQAVLDRIDDVVAFPYPALNERLRIIKHDLAQFAVLNSSHARNLLFDENDPQRAATAADHTIGTEEAWSQPSFYDRFFKGKRPIKLVHLDPTLEAGHLQKAAERTEGLSGREITKLVVAWRAAAYAADPVHSKLDPQLMDKVTSRHIEQTNTKRMWYQEALLNDATLPSSLSSSSSPEETAPGDAGDDQKTPPLAFS